MLNYRLRFERDDNGTVLVTSPDFPLVTFGADQAEATRRAGEAAVAILQSMIDARETIPPSPPRRAGDMVLVLPLQVVLKVSLYGALHASGRTRADLQRALEWQRESVDRLFRLEHASKVEQLAAAFAALGKDVDVSVVDRPAIAALIPA